MDDVSIAGADADAITRGCAFDRTGALATRLTTRDPVTPPGATSHPALRSAWACEPNLRAPGLGATPKVA
jgi:hypothetical protein